LHVCEGTGPGVGDLVGLDVGFGVWAGVVRVGAEVGVLGPVVADGVSLSVPALPFFDAPGLGDFDGDGETSGDGEAVPAP
jgi:hypothetical protein